MKMFFAFSVNESKTDEVRACSANREAYHQKMPSKIDTAALSRPMASNGMKSMCGTEAGFVPSDKAGSTHPLRHFAENPGDFEVSGLAACHLIAPRTEFSCPSPAFAAGAEPI